MAVGSAKLGLEKGSCAIGDVQHSDSTGLFLLFAAGERPTCAALQQFASRQNAVSLSYDASGSAPLRRIEPAPGTGETPVEEVVEQGVLAELLRDGLTFDCTGLAPGRAREFPVVAHRFDLAAIPTAKRYEAVQLVPGQHLRGGERTMPVARGLIALARDILHHFEHLHAVVWPPSQAAIGRRFFESTATAWLEGGAFPALGLTAFREMLDGALQSVGLDFWIGQELRIEPPLSQDKVAATRLGVRLVNQLVIVGGLEESERIVVPHGSRLVMRPSRNRKFVQVWRE
jgi:hypothetical protein